MVACLLHNLHLVGAAPHNDVASLPGEEVQPCSCVGEEAWVVATQWGTCLCLVGYRI